MPTAAINVGSAVVMHLFARLADAIGHRQRDGWITVMRSELEGRDDVGAWGIIVPKS